MPRKITNAEQAEEAIYAAQARIIRAECGAKAAKQANYGWGVDGDEDGVSVATKVYGHGVLESSAYAPDWKITHEWSE